MSAKAPSAWKIVCGGSKKREGKLEKQNNIGMWDTRVFVLYDSGTLAWFKGDERDSWQNCISVRHVTECKVPDAAHLTNVIFTIRNDSKYFSFITKDKTYDLWSDKSDVAQIWADNIRKVKRDLERAAAQGGTAAAAKREEMETDRYAAAAWSQLQEFRAEIGRHDKIVDAALKRRDTDPSASLSEFSLASRHKQIVELIARRLDTVQLGQIANVALRSEVTAEQGRLQEQGEKVCEKLLAVLGVDNATVKAEQEDSHLEEALEGPVWQCEFRWDSGTRAGGGIGWQPAQIYSDPPPTSDRPRRAGAHHWIDKFGEGVRKPDITSGKWVVMDSMDKMQWRYGPFFPTMDKMLTFGVAEPGPNDMCRWKGWDLMESTDPSSPQSKEGLATRSQFFDAVKWTVNPGMIGRNTSSAAGWGLMFSEGWVGEEETIARAKKKCIEMFFSKHWDPDHPEGRCIAFGHHPQHGVQFYNSLAWGADPGADAESALSLEPNPEWTTFKMDLDELRAHRSRFKLVMKSLSLMHIEMPSYANCMPQHIDTQYSYPPAATAGIFVVGQFLRGAWPGELVTEHIALHPGKKVWFRSDLDGEGISWHADARKGPQAVKCHPKTNLVCAELVHSGSQITWECFNVSDFTLPTAQQAAPGKGFDPKPWEAHEGCMCAVSKGQELGQLLLDSSSREFKAPTPPEEIVWNAIDKAKTMPGCVAFAVNPVWGVQWYSAECFGKDGKLRDNEPEWVTWVCGPIAQYTDV